MVAIRVVRSVDRGGHSPIPSWIDDDSVVMITIALSVGNDVMGILGAAILRAVIV